MKIQETEAKSIITLSALPDTDYVVNPYTGCQFACIYCYASFMGRFVNEPIKEWGNYVYVKANAVKLFEHEIQKLKVKSPNARILLSSVTDAYHGIEKKYRLTRGILTALSQTQYPGLISILTKSPMVLDDLDIIKMIPNIEVGITITSTDDKISRFVEQKAPLTSARLKTLRVLNQHGIKTYAFIGPILPHLRLRQDAVDELFRSVADAGTKEIYVEHLNISNYLRSRIFDNLEDNDEIRQFYAQSQTKNYRDELSGLINALVIKYGFNLRLKEAIYHKDK